MHVDDLRRIDRVNVCCRVDVRDRYGIWTGITEDVCQRGCRIRTHRLPALGSVFTMRLSSDLFPDELEVRARVVWGTQDRIGVAFVEAAPRRGTLSPAEWLDLVVEHGRPCGPGLHAVEGPRVVPVVAQAHAKGRLESGRAESPGGASRDNVVQLPLRNG